jgi:hypothetical protein
MKDGTPTILYTKETREHSLHSLGERRESLTPLTS